MATAENDRKKSIRIPYRDGDTPKGVKEVCWGAILPQEIYPVRIRSPDTGFQSPSIRMESKECVMTKKRRTAITSCAMRGKWGAGEA